jgi:hypothetical protein
LLDKAPVGIDLEFGKIYLSSSALQHGDHLAESVLVSLQEVGDDDGDASADAGHAVDEDVGLFPRLFYEVEGLLKVPIYGVIFVVFSWDVEVVWNVFPFVRN